MCTNDVNVIRPQPLQTSLKIDVHALGARAAPIGNLAGAVAGRHRVLGANDHFLTVSAGGHPLADPVFALAVLVVVGCVDEVAALVDEEVEELEGLFFGTVAEECFVIFAEGWIMVSMGLVVLDRGYVLRPPKQRGLTLIEAVGAKSRCRPSRLLGTWAMLTMLCLMVCVDAEGWCALTALK